MSGLLAGLAPFWPQELTLTLSLGLLLASFLGSFLTAALGVGGGAFVLIVMASVLPPLALIPVHGMVQLGSNLNRAWLTRPHLRRDIAVPFTLGSLAAAIIAGLILLFALRLDDLDWVPPVIALFILWLCWGPMPALGLVSRPALTATGGFVTTLATMVIGASGPLVSAWLGRALGDRLVYTACFAWCMSVQHTLKLMVFAALGFVFWPWLLFVLAMVLVGFLGTVVGLKALHRLPERWFRVAFRWVLTALALRVLWTQLQT